MNTLTAIEEELQRLDLSCFQLEDRRMFRNLNCCFNGDFSDFEREQDKLSRTIENKLDQLSSIESSEISDLDQNGKLLEKLHNRKLLEKLRFQLGQMHERMGVAKEWSNPYRAQERHYRER